MVLVFPECFQLNTSDVKQYSMRLSALEGIYGANIWRTRDRQSVPDWSESHFLLLDHAIPQALRLESEAISPENPSAKELLVNCISRPDLVHCFGEIVDTCLDGDVIVRFGASHDAEEKKIRPDRVMILASGDTFDSDDDSEWTEEETASDSDEAINEILSGTDNDTDTDDSAGIVEVDSNVEEKCKLELQEKEAEARFVNEKGIMMAKDSADGQGTAEPQTTDPALEIPLTTSVATTNCASMPQSFQLMDSPIPQDHHFIHRNISLTAPTMKRIAKEHMILASSLPEGVFVRSWEARLDLLRILIIGPVDTPYEYAPFVIDMCCNSSFPTQPPDAHFHSWTNNGGRINPNLYEDGNICLSLLGTWHADDSHETWSRSKSTILQIIVSILGLVLVKEPYYSKHPFTMFFTFCLAYP